MQPLRDILQWEQGTSWVFPLVLLGLPIAILLHEVSALLEALIHWVLDQQAFGQSRTRTGPWLEFRYGFIILPGFPMKAVQPLGRSHEFVLGVSKAYDATANLTSCSRQSCCEGDWSGDRGPLPPALLESCGNAFQTAYIPFQTSRGVLKG